MSYISVEVDIDDIVSELSRSRSDRRDLFHALQEDGYISENCVITNDGEVKAPEKIERSIAASENDEFNIALDKLWNNGWKLTREEEEYIISLSKRFV
jgi:hypothetical protein